jgi:putative membrane protein
MSEPPPLAERATLIRTRLALERTLMAWLRTAISMITFGFTLFKAIQYAHELGIKSTGDVLSVNVFALALIGIGLVALALATVQHLRHARTLRNLDSELPVFSPGAALAMLFAGVGLLALISVLLSHW